MMRRHFRRPDHSVPELNMASLPDLIFTVLFFFMIVTHMRKVTLKVEYQVPQGTELTRLTKKTAVSYVHIGKRNGQKGNDMQVQLNDKFAQVEDIAGYVAAERDRMSPADLPNMTVSIKADRSAPMGLITDVKQQLRRANALRINYSAEEYHGK